MLRKHLAKFPPLDPCEVHVRHDLLKNFTPAVVYFGDAKSLNPFSLQILLLRVHYILSPYNWRRLWGRICALASAVVSVKKLRATLSEINIRKQYNLLQQQLFRSQQSQEQKYATNRKGKNESTSFIHT